MNEAKDYKLVKVTWLDAQSHDAWSSAEDVDESIPECVTVGYLIHSDKIKLGIAGTLGMDDQVCCVMQVPVGMVLKVEYLCVLEQPEPAPAKRARMKRVAASV